LYSTRKKMGQCLHPIWEEVSSSFIIKILSVSYCNFAFGWNAHMFYNNGYCQWLFCLDAIIFCCCFGFDISYRECGTNYLKYLIICLHCKCYCLDDAGRIMVLGGGSCSAPTVVIIFHFISFHITYFMQLIAC